MINFLVPLYNPSNWFLERFEQFVIHNKKNRFIVLFDGLHNPELMAALCKDSRNVVKICVERRLGLIDAHLYLLSKVKVGWVAFIHQDDLLFRTAVKAPPEQERHCLFVQPRRVWDRGSGSVLSYPSRYLHNSAASGNSSGARSHIRRIISRNYIGAPSSVLFYLRNTFKIDDIVREISPLFFDIVLYASLFCEGYRVRLTKSVWSDSLHGSKDQASNLLTGAESICTNLYDYDKLLRKYGCRPTINGVRQAIGDDINITLSSLRRCNFSLIISTFLFFLYLKKLVKRVYHRRSSRSWK